MANVIKTGSKEFDALHSVLSNAGILPKNCIGFSIHARANDVVRVECEYYPTDEQIAKLNAPQPANFSLHGAVVGSDADIADLTDRIVSQMKRNGL